MSSNDKYQGSSKINPATGEAVNHIGSARQRPTSLLLTATNEEGALLRNLRKNSPVEALQERYMNNFVSSKKANITNDHEVRYVPVEMNNKDCAPNKTAIKCSQEVEGDSVTVVGGSCTTGDGGKVPMAGSHQSQGTRSGESITCVGDNSDGYCSSATGTQRQQPSQHRKDYCHGQVLPNSPFLIPSPTTNNSQLPSTSNYSLPNKYNSKKIISDQCSDINEKLNTESIVSRINEGKVLGQNAGATGVGESVASAACVDLGGRRLSESLTEQQRVGVASASARPHNLTTALLRADNLDKLSAPSVVGLCQTKNEQFFSAGDSKRDPKATAMESLFSAKPSTYEPQSVDHSEYLPSSWSAETATEDTKTGIAVDAERIIEQTRKLSSTNLNNLDSPSPPTYKSNIYDKRSCFESRNMSRDSTESNVSIEKDSLDERRTSSSDELSNENGIVQGLLSFPIEALKQQQKSSSLSGKHGVREAEQHQQADNDVTSQSRPLAAKQTKIQNDDVMPSRAAGSSRQPLHQAQQSQVHQKHSDQSTCKIHGSSGQPDMGSVFSKGRTRGSSQPPIVTPTNTSYATSVTPVASHLRSPQLKDRVLIEKPRPSYVSQSSEPSRRYSGFSHVTSDNVRRMRDVWGTRQQDKPPVAPSIPATPPNFRNQTNNNGNNIPSRAQTPQRNNTNSTSSPLTSRRAASPATPHRSSSPNPYRRPTTPNNVNERLERTVHSPIHTRTRCSGSNSPAGRNATSFSASPSRQRTSQSPNRFNNKPETNVTSKNARSSSATRTQYSPETNRASQSPTKLDQKFSRNKNTPPSTPTRRNFPSHIYDSPERSSPSRNVPTDKYSTNDILHQKCRSSPSRESRQTSKSSSTRTSSKPKSSSTPTTTHPTKPSNPQSTKISSPTIKTSSPTTKTSSSSTKTSSPTTKTSSSSKTSTSSPASRRKSSPKENSKSASSVHKRIFKRLRDASLRPDSETLCFIEQEDRYKVSSNVYLDILINN